MSGPQPAGARPVARPAIAPVPRTGPAARPPQAPTRPRGEGRQRWNAPAIARLLLVLAFIVAVGLLARSGWYTAKSDFGYWLGVVGGSMMLALLLYPLRKRVEGRVPLGPLRWWFAAHMALGVAGPVLIILHCTLRLGSLNASIAFWSMAVVASSGLAGRFLYGRLHAGLHGRQRSLAELKVEAASAMAEAAPWLHGSEALRAELERHAAACDAVARHGLARPLALCTLGWRGRRTMARCRALLRGAAPAAARPGARGVETLLQMQVDAQRAAAQFRAFERLFALWHVAHIPLVFIMVLSAIAHVIAVHMY